jgi:hypothetical protein
VMGSMKVPWARPQVWQVVTTKTDIRAPNGAHHTSCREALPWAVSLTVC